MLAIPEILYESESSNGCMVLDEQATWRIESTEMKFWRFVAGYTHVDIKINTDFTHNCKYLVQLAS